MSYLFFDYKLFKLSDRELSGSTAQGSFKKRLLIFFEAPQEQATELTDFLAKVLKAIQVDLKEDTIFIHRKPTENFKIVEILEKNNARQVLIFGTPPPELGIRFILPPYRNVSHQGRLFLWADSLVDIFAERQAGGKAMSGKLWKAIQQFDL